MFVDVHAHLTHEEFNDDVEKVINRAFDNKVLVVCAGSGLKDNQAVLRLCESHKGVLASLGLYPWDAVSITDDEVDYCIENIRERALKIVCVGEIGLDYHWGKGKEDLDKQYWVFNKMLELALDIKKPALIHCRQAEHEALEVLRSYEGNSIIHCYTGPLKFVPDFLNLGCYFSIPAAVARNKSLRNLVKLVPMTQLLTETDSPYMGLEPGGRNEPVKVIEGLKKISEIKKLSIKETEAAIFDNFKRLFKISNI